MKKVLVIRFSALGDVAMLAAVLKEFIQTPGSEEVSFTVLSRERMAPLFDGVAFYGADLKGRHEGIKGLNLLLRDIDYRQFDAVVDCHNVLRSRYLDFRFHLAGKQVYILSKHRFAKWWLTCRFNRHKRPLTPMPEQYRQLLTKVTNNH